MPKVTIEQLAFMVQQGFEQVNERLDQGATKADLDLVKADVRKVSNGLDALREDVGERLTTVADALSGNISRTNRRLDELQEHVAAVKDHTGLR